MVKLTVTNAVISKGYNGAPAIQTSESGNVARFRIGYRVYDKQAEGNYRYVNLTVKAFGSLIKKLSDMKLSDGAVVNLSGRLDEEVWTDKKTNETRKTFSVILEEIEYTASGKSHENAVGGADQSATPVDSPAADPAPENRSGFGGYEPFGPSFFDD